jgi:tetrapyrrole methylase family protein/MazG family protein
MHEAREQKAFTQLIAVCRRLRGPDGCPWDREQTLESMTPYLLEEAAESGQAIAENDPDKIAEELGDHVFLGLFCLELLRERAGIGIAEGLERGADKLIRRHPHVYADAKVADGDAAYHQWQQIKQREQGAGSLLGEQPPGLAALVAAYRTQEKAGAVGFDWPEVSGPLAKVQEEIAEVERAMAEDDPRAKAREVGDLLFAAVNLARHLGIDPERELGAATRRFRARFHHIERRLAEQGQAFKGTPLAELDALWDEAKVLAANEGTT